LLYLYNQVLLLPHHFIRLFNNKLTDACTQHFARLLKEKQNFLSLRSALTWSNYVSSGLWDDDHSNHTKYTITL